MARDIFGNRKIERVDRDTHQKYSESDIRWIKFKIVIWIVLGALYMYFMIQPQTWF
jgi:hypothetical protein